MLLETVANRYAEALYGMARAEGKAKQQLKELEQVNNVIAHSRALGRAVQSPTIPAQVKKNILRDVLHKEKITPRTLHFFYLLVDKSREVYVRAVVDSFREFLRRDEGVIKCRAEVASPLDEEMKNRLIEQITKATRMKVELEVVERPELLAGAILTVGDRLIDGSFSSQLTHIRKRFARIERAVVY
ncbi:ATP synthase F1 subunit delta [bacterium CPR1]|nr:ATP synthase F1 subunit delta [bacterium CPR1]